MTEIRRDPVTGRQVIVAVERGQRPSDFKVEDCGHQSKEHIETCPFCLGNEDKTPIEKFRFEGKNNWQVRVIPNLYSALTLDSDIKGKNHRLFNSNNGLGIHEVIIESSKHNKSFFNMTIDEIGLILKTYKKRYDELISNGDIKYISIFKNYKSGAGASLEHPHSQIIASKIIPSLILEETARSSEYYSKNKKCIYCDILEEELVLDKRVVMVGKYFVVITPFASRYKYETVVLPIKHSSNFGKISIDEIKELSSILKELFNRKKNVLGDFPFNLFIHTIPKNIDGFKESYHWHLHITPRLSISAGYELGTDIFINTISPEKAALSLKD